MSTIGIDTVDCCYDIWINVYFSKLLNTMAYPNIVKLFNEMLPWPYIIGKIHTRFKIIDLQMASLVRKIDGREVKISIIADDKIIACI